EVAAHWPRKRKCVQAIDSGGVAGRERRHRVGVGTGAKVAAKILKARACLERVSEAVGQPAVEAGGRCFPCRRNEAVVKLRPLDAIKRGGFVMFVDVADRNQINAGRAPVELVHDLEVDPDLLDLGSAVQLIVAVETGSGMLELD